MQSDNQRSFLIFNEIFIQTYNSPRTQRHSASWIGVQ